MRRVALLIETSRTYGRDLLRGVQQFVTEAGPWSLFVEVRDLDSRPPVWLRHWDGDGVLTRSGSDAIARAVARVNVPVVELRSLRRGHQFPFVGVNNEAVAALVVDHLWERGLRHFGVYALETEAFFVDRRKSFEHLVRQRQATCDLFQQAGRTERPAEWERQQSRLMHWLRALPKPVGILACTDQLGCWLLDACVRAGLRVPEEVAVVGVENDETLTELSTPPLSSVRLDGEQAGYLAAKLLNDMMTGQVGRADVSRETLIPPLCVETRLSSDVVAVSDPALSAAIAFMRRRACEPISVSDVLAVVPLSRSSLERGCRRVLGRSPNAELTKIRLAKAKELLIDTDLKLDEIARRAGFNTAQYLVQKFRELQGTTPGAFRRRRRGK